MSVGSLTSSVVKSVTRLPRKIFGTRNDRILKAYRRQVPAISAFEPELRADYDQKYAERSTVILGDDSSDEERTARLQEIRVELSKDLRDRADALKDRLLARLADLDHWWDSLAPSQRLDEYFREEYRKRNTKVNDSLDSEGIIAEAFAILREASRRARDHRHFDCQLIGGRVLFEGRIAEMKTGEGKTIVCHLAAFIKALAGHKTHVVTVNDYLVKRDAEFAAPIFELLDISVGYIQSQLDPGGHEGLRRRAYACDLTYGTNSEFGFDYLRDNMKTELSDQVQGALDYVIVDEVDSILIDEARTPLIISGPARDDVTRYPRANKVADELIRRQTVWDRRVRSTVARFDGNTNNIPKLGDAMGILGYTESKVAGGKASAPADVTDGKQKDEEDSGETPTLGPDFLTDDQAEAIQFYENDILKLSPTEQYRRYFIVQRERRQVGLTHEGVTIAQELLDIGSLYSGSNMEWPHLIENALRAHKVYQCDVDYVVQNGEIIIVDPFTGRLMHGRQWSDGLHQAVEARESVHVKQETQTLATITIQNFIKLYRAKAGMTGTAATEATEFDKIYKLEVVEIPTNRPVNREEHNDKMYRDVDAKYAAIVDEVHDIHRRGRPADPFLLADILTALKPILEAEHQDTQKISEALKQFNQADFGDKKVIGFMTETYDEAMGDLAHGRPVLVGTTSVENSEKVSKLLTQRYGIEHEVLNAKNHSREAEIVAKAGFCTTSSRGSDKEQLGNVTIATNMAGRGTDIKLGEGVVYDKCKVPQQLPAGVQASPLFPAGITKCCIHCDEYDAATNCAHCYKPKLDSRFPALGRNVCTLNVPCGLHIIGTERHEARRIDNQLRGRCGRQGDPGSSRFSLSLQDDLLKLFMSEWMLKMMEKLGFSDGSSLEDKRLSKGIERAQRKVEERNFSTRKHLLDWDEPMDFQRKEFYTARQRILEERDLPGLILQTIGNTIEHTLEQYLSADFSRTCIAEWCRSQIDLSIEEDRIAIDDVDSAKASIRGKAIDEAQDMIRTSLGEYIDPEEPPAKWDVGGLLNWAQRLFKFGYTQNQLRKMEPQEIEDALTEAAEEHYQEVDLDGIALYLDPLYPHRALMEWAKSKFDIRLDENDVVETPKEEIAELLQEKVRGAYREREISYPVESCLDRAFGPEGVDHSVAINAVAAWANGKFNVSWNPEDLQRKQPAELRDELLQLNESYFDGLLAEEIDRNIAGKDREDAIEWAKRRFGPAWNDDSFARSNGDIRESLLAQGREMLRWELTRLEQAVLLRIYDLAWKDHLLEMDHLKDAIMQRPLGGDQSHPQSQYAIEGRELFSQMWVRIETRVTDMIFKVRASVTDRSAKSSAEGSARLSLSHADSTGAGFTGPSRDREAAMRAQGVENKVETIRREEPKVGRNQPCPCGSGKKYKQCHGKK